MNAYITMDQPPSPPQPRDNKHNSIIDIPIISTTISSILHSSQQDSQASADTSANAPAGLASYLPTSVAPMWFRKASKPAVKPGARELSPAKSVGFSERSSVCSDTESRQSHDSITTERGRKTKRASRPKSTYSICYAPPRTSNFNKIKVRARPLLQLHKLESRARPRPELELIPSAIFSSRLKKAAAKFSSSKHSIGPSDLAIVRAEKYHEHEAATVEVDESKDLLAILSGVAKGRRSGKEAKLHLEGNVDWDAYRLPNGAYECVTTDSHGLTQTVRWVPKKEKAMTNEDTPAIKKFNFSTIIPGTRRHPVIANLTHDGLDISDSYTIPSPSRADSPATALARSTSDQQLSAAEPSITTTEELRCLIAASAIFVALCEGWCPGYGEDLLSRSPSMRSYTSPPGAPRRATSFDSESLRGAGSMRQALRSPSFFRSESVKHDSRPSSPASSFTLDEKSIHPIKETDSYVPPSPGISPRRPRADTTATVIVSSPVHAQWQPPAEDETEDEADEDEAAPDAMHDPIDSEHSSNAATLVNAAERPRATQEKRTMSASTTNSTPKNEFKEKKLSTASTAVSRSPARKTELAGKPEKKPKSGLRRVLLCGLF